MSEIPETVYIYPQKNAYAVIQDEVAKGFSFHIKKENKEIETIVIVGAYWGLEIPELLQRYPNATIYAFEAHPAHFRELHHRFSETKRVVLFNQVIASCEREVVFNEISIPGSGSIFEYQGDKFGDNKKVEQRILMQSKALVDFLPEKIIDLLWVDVQGAELEVLRGTELRNVKSMFLEVKTRQHVKAWDAEPYKGQCFLEDLLKYLKGSHKLVAIGLDNEYNNGQGNSFWIMENLPDVVKPKLSILICSLKARAFYLDRLKKVLAPQVLPLGGDVEVLLSVDEGQASIGAKRNSLLQRAKGDYIAFVDDDDTVSNSYVQQVLRAVETKPDVVGMSLLMYTDGANPQLSTHSLKYKTWWDEPDPVKPQNKRYYRNPNHLNPVKRELALRAGFPSINMCEDRKYSADLLPFLNTEVFVEEPIYNYLVRSQKEC